LLLRTSRGVATALSFAGVRIKGGNGGERRGAQVRGAVRLDPGCG